MSLFRVLLLFLYQASSKSCCRHSPYPKCVFRSRRRMNTNFWGKSDNSKRVQFQVIFKFPNNVQKWSLHKMGRYQIAETHFCIANCGYKQELYAPCSNELTASDQTPGVYPSSSNCRVLKGAVMIVHESVDCPIMWECTDWKLVPECDGYRRTRRK